MLMSLAHLLKLELIGAESVDKYIGLLIFIVFQLIALRSRGPAQMSIRIPICSAELSDSEP